MDLYPDDALVPGGAGTYMTYRLGELRNDALSNPVTGIALDGDLADWETVTPLDPDPDDVSGESNLLDWRRARLAHDATHFHVAYENQGPITLNWGFSLYLDTDQNRTTGFRGSGDSFPIGADFLLQGPNLFRYAGDGQSWSWIWVGTADFATLGGIAELSVPLAWMEDTGAIDLFLIGDNRAFPGGTALDLYPDNALLGSEERSFFSYRISP